MNEKKLIVSVTSYPKRIGTVALALESIYAQTRPADEVVLWLAEEQFPEKEAQLPENLTTLMEEGKLTVRWCDDLKSHKKYFYALQDYADSLVVTIDDDLVYPEHMLENLYQSYLRHPNAVSTVRAHLMVFDSKGNLMPYQDWIQETDLCMDKPSMQLFATGGAGTLYPPSIFRKELFDKQAVIDTCLYADDLWLKVMALLSDVPVVVAQEFEDLRYIPGSQEEALYLLNVDENQNDVQMDKITAWADATYGTGILGKKLNDSGIGEDLRGVDVLYLHLRKERAVRKAKLRDRGNRLKQAYADKSAINAKLQQTYAEKSELTVKLKDTYAEKSELKAKLNAAYAEKSALNAKLQQTYAEKSQINAEKARLTKELKEAKAQIEELRSRKLVDRILNR